MLLKPFLPTDQKVKNWVATRLANQRLNVKVKRKT